MNKKDIRKSVLALRDGISAQDKAQYDASIRKIVTEMEDYSEAEVILAYVSYRSEVDTTALIQRALADGKYVFAPKVSGNEMEFWQITAMQDLQEGYRGIREPKQSITFPDWIREKCRIVNADTVADKAEGCVQEVCKVMMWMPGAAFDKKRHRIGYGGGFYDRYLNRMTGDTDDAEWTRNNLAGQVSLVTAALAYSCQILEQIPYEEHDIRPALLITELGICC